MAIPAKQGLILLVDDELAIVKIIEEFLLKIGYRVISTTDSVTAFELFKQHKNNISLVITDLTMPGFCGDELITQIRTIRPDVPVILCTGYGEAVGYGRATGIEISACLAKPVTRDELFVTIDQALSKGKKEK